MAVAMISDRHQKIGHELLHRQCWNWGRDIIRPEGNLLLKAGFSKHPTPDKEKGSSYYSLEMSNGDRLMLWGFGLLYVTPVKGCVYLNRYEFEPIWFPKKAIREPIWTPSMMPVKQSPPSLTIPIEIVIAAIRYIAGYEEWVLSVCGLEYRLNVLQEWEQPTELLPPQDLPQSWLSLADSMYPMKNEIGKKGLFQILLKLLVPYVTDRA